MEKRLVTRYEMRSADAAAAGRREQPRRLRGRDARPVQGQSVYLHRHRRPDLPLQTEDLRGRLARVMSKDGLVAAAPSS